MLTPGVIINSCLFLPCRHIELASTPNLNFNVLYVDTHIVVGYMHACIASLPTNLAPNLRQLANASRGVSIY
jgi:hypothetical protein